MESEAWATRALSFGAVAEDYDRFRPGPPADAVTWLLPERCEAVVDIGAGTGGLTRELVGRAPRVIAVEPDPRMAAVLAARVPQAGVLNGRAEEVPLRDGAVDAVLGSSMWHWVEEERAFAEVARLVRPGGVLGLMWSGPDRSQGFLAELLARPDLPLGTRDGERDARRRRLHEVHPPRDAPFVGPETRTLHWSQAMTSEQLTGLARTYSPVIRLSDSERTALRDRTAGVLGSAFAGRHEIDVPMRCACWRAVRA